MINYWFLISLGLVIFSCNNHSQKTSDQAVEDSEKIPMLFKEQDGIVSMEAENATELFGWKEVYGKKNCSNLTLMDLERPEGGKLIYRIYFTTPGAYTIWALQAKSTKGYRSDMANDCFASFDGKSLQINGGTSCDDEHGKVIGLGTHQTELGWQSRPKTECVEDRKHHVLFLVKEVGWYSFRIDSRSEGYLLDKLVFVHEDNPYIPTGTGPHETRFDRSKHDFKISDAG